MRPGVKFLLPHLRPHEPTLAVWHGQSDVSCAPRQVTGTGASQGGHAVALVSILGPTASHGVAPFLASSTFTLTWSWHGAGQEWPQGCSDRLHTCDQRSSNQNPNHATYRTHSLATVSM